MENNNIVEVILKSYENNQSIKATAKEAGCSWNRVVKILSSNGVIVNDIHSTIMGLYEKGMNAQDISKQTGCNIKTVQSYLPAVRPIYKYHQSENARKIAQMRAKRKMENGGV